jgi:DNA-binding response OmpR family regulator
MITILVIEDDNEIRQSIADLLELNDYNVLIAANGEEGIRLAQQHVPDIILSDIMMPGIDGYEVLSQLKKNPATAIVPFIFLTAKSDIGSTRKGMGLGADDYLAKPFMPEELIASIEARVQKYTILRTQVEALRLSVAKTVPHEFLTPLNSILGFAEIIYHNAANQQALSSEELMTFAGIIRDSGNRLLRLVQNYILFSKLASDTSEQQTPDSLIGAEAVIADTASEIIKIYQRDNDFHTDIDSSTPAITGGDLSKIIVELIDNACKFSESGTPIQLTAHENTDTYIITVTNKGRGLTPEQIAGIGPHVQFEREHYEQQGAGLGLAIVQLLCRKYAGRLEVESVYGSSLSAKVLLPIVPPLLGL